VKSPGKERAGSRNLSSEIGILWFRTGAEKVGGMRQPRAQATCAACSGTSRVLSMAAAGPLLHICSFRGPPQPSRRALRRPSAV
jgi:hypothetical protein